MHFSFLATSLLLTATALAEAGPEPAPYMLVGVMSKRDLFGLGLSKRQTAGYAPTQTYCNGEGTTCDVVCGPGQQQCASNDDVLHCYDPTQKQTCCPDLTGNACDDGYYCTEDTSGNTWCCPNNLDTAACAAAFSVTGGLSVLPTATSSTPSASASASTTPVTSSSSTPLSSSSSSSSSPAPVVPSTPTVTPISGSNSTVTTPPVVQFTGAANAKSVVGGLAGLAIGLAGVVAAL